MANLRETVELVRTDIAAGTQTAAERRLELEQAEAAKKLQKEEARKAFWRQFIDEARDIFLGSNVFQVLRDASREYLNEASLPSANSGIRNTFTSYSPSNGNGRCASVSVTYTGGNADGQMVSLEATGYVDIRYSPSSHDGIPSWHRVDHRGLVVECNTGSERRKLPGFRKSVEWGEPARVSLGERQVPGSIEGQMKVQQGWRDPELVQKAVARVLIAKGIA